MSSRHVPVFYMQYVKETSTLGRRTIKELDSVKIEASELTTCYATQYY